MLKKENAYFENLIKISDAFTTIKKAHEEKKQDIIKTYGWDSDELKAWREEDSKLKYPISQGACKAYRAWSQSIEHEADEVEMSDFLWDREVADFTEAMKGAGIESFIFTNASSALMDNIHDLEANGWKMTGLAEFKKKDRWTGEEIIRGLRFEAR